MEGERYLVVMADDFGIGLETSRGILDLASRGLVTSAVLLVNSPYASGSVQMWRERGEPLELGWHACLTYGRPILPASEVPSLVDRSGRFASLGVLMRRVFSGRVSVVEVQKEFQAQLDRFVELVGCAPTVVNTHHHVQVFEPVGHSLVQVLGNQVRLPYLRRVVEPWKHVALIPGARIKRGFLSTLGRGDATRSRRLGFPGNDVLVGITNPRETTDPRFLTRWLGRAGASGEIIEITCHPGYPDRTLLDVPGEAENERWGRREQELNRLLDPAFLDLCRGCPLRLVRPCELPQSQPARRLFHAA